jgi:hypothetical protein
MRARLEARTAVGGFDAEHVSSELDAALEGDRIPAHDADGVVIEDAVIETPAEPDPNVDPPAPEFPGDRPATAPAEAGPPTLADRTDAYLKRIGEAKTTIKLKAVRAASEQLRKELDAADPERLVEVEEVFNAKWTEIEDAEKAAKK